MTVPVAPVCPRCQAFLPAGAGVGPVACVRCGTGVWLEPAGQPVPPPPQYAHLPRVAVGAPPFAQPAGHPAVPNYGAPPGFSGGPAPQGGAPAGFPARTAPRAGAPVGAGRMVGLAAGIILPVGIAIAAFALKNQITNVVMSPSSPLMGGSGTGINITKIDASDAKHVDMTEIIRQARAIAVKTNPRAVLTTVVVQKTTGGVVDITGDNTADVGFAWSYHDTTKPAGADLVQGSMTFAVYDGSFRTVSMSSGAMGTDRPLADPTCTSAKAWASAVASGVPSNAVGSMHLYDNTAFSPKSPVVWSVRVEGHDEYRRELDARDCHLVKSWAK